MKTYFRLLKYTSNIYKFVIPFFILTALATVFGVLNFTLLIPVLDILFSKDNNEVILAVEPILEYNIDYIKAKFDYEIKNVVFEKGKIYSLYIIVSVIVVSVFISNIFRYLSSRLLINYKLNTVVSLRRILFDKIVGMDVSYFTSTRRGDIIARVLSDTGEIEGLLPTL